MSTKKLPTDTIFYHVGQGKTPWREAVANIPVNATDEQITAIASTITRIESAFPLPQVNGINSWYNNEFVTAYLAVRTTAHLQSMLYAMAEKGSADPGQVVLNWGAKYPTLTIAEVEAKDCDYLDWVSKQQGLDAYRLTAAIGAYRLMTDEKGKANG
jgi:hypothetical protein